MKARTLLAAALAALLVPAAALAAPAKARPARAAAAEPASGMQGLSVGGFIGYETDDLSGLSLRLDGELPFRALSPQVNLSWVGSLGYSRLSDDLGGGFDFVANVVKVIPAARFTFAVNPQLSIFGDAGLGFYYASWELDVPSFFGGSTTVDDSEFSLLMRIGAGAWYQMNEKTRIGAMLEFDPFFGDFDQTTFIIQAGAMFTL
jgi:opacity protein-like surface antigen